MAVVAKTKGIGVSTKKLKFILDTVRGKNVNEALNTLRYLPSPSAVQVAKVIKAAMANAENNYMIDSQNLKIVEIYAGEGARLKRFRARARGRAAPITRKTSRLTVVVDEEK